MHLLPGVLTLLLAVPAAASPITPMAGHWRGRVTTSPGNCNWAVTASVREGEDGAAGDFSYSGPCYREVTRGTFTLRPAEGSCYALTANVPGLPALEMTLCVLSASKAAISSPLFNGEITLSKDGRIAGFRVSALVGGAFGTLRKITGAKKGGTAKGAGEKSGNKPKVDQNVLRKGISRPTLEVHGGGD